jgi:hypothetical protein
MGIAIVFGICNIITLPVEYWLRPRFGTRYFHPVTIFFSFVMMIFFSAVITLITGLGRMLPFGGMAHRSAPLTFGMFFVAYFFTGVYHNFRTWRLMLNPQLEEHSQFEGHALAFFRLLPKGKSFWFVRIVWEPLTLLSASLLLSRFQIAEWSVTLYLFIAAFAMFAKNGIEWFQTFSVMRDILDAKARGRLLAKFAEGSASGEELASIHLSQFPASAPPEVKKAAAAKIAGLPPEIERLVYPIESHTA